MMHRDVSIDADDYKTITVEKLIAILQKLPPDAEVWANQVKNLSVGHNLQWIGWIDIANERYHSVLAEEDDEDGDE